MLAGFGGGALVGTIIYGAVGSRLPRRATFVGAFLSVTIPFAVLASEPDLLIAVAALIILGGVTGPINPLLMTLFHERIPAHMRGRIFGLVMAIAWSAMPVGMLVAGYLLERIGIRFTMIAVAASFLITALGLVINPTLHHLDPLDEDRGPDITGDV
jgi:predicted MFS family arabinose efflux permease